MPAGCDLVCKAVCWPTTTSNLQKARPSAMGQPQLTRFLLRP
jgi:hypothetical protein